MIFPQEQIHSFHFNSTSVTGLVKQNQLNFYSIEVNKPLVSQSTVFRSSDSSPEADLAFATNQMPDHT